jgi:cytochrome P450
MNPTTLAAVLLAIVFIYLLITYLLNGAPRKAGEPQIIGYWFPFVGVAIQFGKDPIEYLRSLVKKYGNVFTIILSGERTHIITNPEHYKQIFSKSEFDFHQLSEEMSARLAPASVDAETIKKQDSVLKIFLQGKSLEKMNQDVVRIIQKKLHSMKEQKGTINFTEFVWKTVHDVAALSLFGDSFDSDACYPHMKIFDENIHFYLVKQLFPFSGFLDKHRDAIGDLLSKVDFSKSGDLVKERMEIFENNGYNPLEVSKLNIIILWVAITNTVPSIIWTFYYILRDEKIKNEILKEIQPFVESNYDMKYLNELPLLDACFTEALRLSSTTASSSISSYF